MLVLFSTTVQYNNTYGAGFKLKKIVGLDCILHRSFLFGSGNWQRVTLLIN
jgi:hypothetical protein